jgi:hypothetical protein
MATFKKEISYLSLQIVDGEHKEVEVTKTFTFKDLSRRDPEQGKLFFRVSSIVGSNEDGAYNIDSDALYDLTKKALSVLMLTGSDYETTEIDKREVVSDSGALLSFGIWFLKEKYMPFFLQYKTSLQGLM